MTSTADGAAAAIVAATAPSAGGWHPCEVVRLNSIPPRWTIVLCGSDPTQRGNWIPIVWWRRLLVETPVRWRRGSAVERTRSPPLVFRVERHQPAVWTGFHSAPLLPLARCCVEGKYAAAVAGDGVEWNDEGRSPLTSERIDPRRRVRQAAAPVGRVAMQQSGLPNDRRAADRTSTNVEVLSFLFAIAQTFAEVVTHPRGETPARRPSWTTIASAPQRF